MLQMFCVREMRGCGVPYYPDPYRAHIRCAQAGHCLAPVNTTAGCEGSRPRLPKLAICPPFCYRTQVRLPLERLRHGAKLGAFSLLGAGAYPVLAARVLSRQRSRSSIPPAPSAPFPKTDPKGTGAVSTLLAFMPDLAVYLSELYPDAARLTYDYPPDFERVTVDVGRGVKLACRVARQPQAAQAPTLLFVPGMFATVTQNVVVQLAKRARERWGFNVVVADMRDFGDTARLNRAPSSLGDHEGDDVVALAGWARRELGSAHVSVMGFSFGGAVALSAALRGEGHIDSCVAFCPPLHARELILHFSQPVRGASSFSLFQIFYQWLLLRSSELRGRGEVEHLHDYVSKVSAAHYEVDEDTLYSGSDIASRITALAVPTLIIHADDDPVVPFEHTLALEQTASRAGNTQLEVVISKGGGHYGHWAVMPDWTERTICQFLARVTARDSNASSLWAGLTARS